MTVIDTLNKNRLQGQGLEPADLVIKNVNILNIVTGDIRRGDIAIAGETIVGVYDEYHGTTEIDGTGLTAVPGFIDTHYHNESSLVTPQEFERMVLPMGTTTSVWDPHEIANVIGTEAFKFALDSANATIMDIKVNLSSCVPATPIGTAGANITAKDLKPFTAAAHGLAEVMNIPGVLNGDEDMLEKLSFFTGGHVDGHMPGLGLFPEHGKLINALTAVNIKTDHECTTMKEALMKHDRGVRILIREGTGCRNLEALMPFINTKNSFVSAFCTDDFHPADIVARGHVSYIIRRAIELYNPEYNGPSKDEHIANVYRMASFSAANIFGLNSRGLERRGELAGGNLADIVLLNNLETCNVSRVIKRGQVVADELFQQRPRVAPVGLNSVKIDSVTPDQFRLEPQKPGDGNVTVVEVIPDNVLTGAIETTLEVRDGELLADPGRDILKAAVIERHGKNGNIGIGFVKGFEFKRGAIASTVGHDDHNITVVGVTDGEMALAVNELKKMQGGYVVVDGDKVIARLPLPVAGLMSDQPYEKVAEMEEHIRKATRSLIPDGVQGLPQPLISLAFISLSVIPDARICDAGLTRNDFTGPRLVWDQRKVVQP